MIDYVSMQTHIKINRRFFRPNAWTLQKADDGSEFFWHRTRAVDIRYYFATNNLRITGKLITLLHDTQVLNVDDLYGKNLSRFIDEFNASFNRLFTRPLVDIRTFTVSRIDYCFNIRTPYKKEYLDFMTTAEQCINNGQQINHTEVYDLSGSLYIKNTAEYAANIRRNYTLNVYDKADRLIYLQERGMQISTEDFENAKDFLRIEVQASYQYIQSLQKRFSIARDFQSFFNYSIALYAICNVFALKLKAVPNADFYKYEVAKNFFRAGSAAAITLRSVATKHKITDKKYAHGRRKIIEQNIYPYCFLPKDCPTDILENPCKLIEKKINAL